MGFLVTARETCQRAVVHAGVLGLMTLTGLVAAAAYGYAVAAAVVVTDDDTDYKNSDDVPPSPPRR